LTNLPDLLRTFNLVYVWDDSVERRTPRLILEVEHGVIARREEPIPSWVSRALAATEFEAPLRG
jgi:hypothetical protein